MANEIDIDELINKLRSHDINHYEGYQRLLDPKIRTVITDSQFFSLLSIFENEPSFVRSDTATILGTLGDERAIDWLLKPITDNIDRKTVDAAILQKAAVALGMIVQSMLQRTDASLPDWDAKHHTIYNITGKLHQSLLIKTQEFQSGSFFFRYANEAVVLKEAINANIAYRLGIIKAIEGYGAIDASVDTLAFIFRGNPLQEDEAIFSAAVDALASCAMSSYLWDAETVGFTIAFVERERAAKMLETIQTMPKMYWRVQERARKALKLLEAFKRE